MAKLAQENNRMEKYYDDKATQLHEHSQAFNQSMQKLDSESIAERLRALSNSEKMIFAKLGENLSDEKFSSYMKLYENIVNERTQLLAILEKNSDKAVDLFDKFSRKIDLNREFVTEHNDANHDSETTIIEGEWR